MTKCTESPSSELIFGEFSVDEAIGVTLAHTLTAGTLKLKKGRLLDADDIAALKQAGIATISGARLTDEDIPEDAAASAIANLLAGSNCAPRKPYTGRCNLHAAVSGVLVVDSAAIMCANRIDEAITVATLPPWAVVRPGQVIATVKIIPFAVKRHVMATLTTTFAQPPLRIAELRPHRAALIMTELPGTPESFLHTAANATRLRLETLGSRLALELRCPHEPFSIVSQLRQARAAGCDMILIAGATSTKDRNDIVPSAIVAAGGRIERFGLPVEPGNMLLLAKLDERPVIVMPGCARSRRLNGLDWILRRLLAGLPLCRDDFAAMGIGGLIRSTREQTDDDTETDATPAETVPANQGMPQVAALVLAAGQSSRMEQCHKLLERIDGIPLIQRAVNASLASRAASVNVVTGHMAEQVQSLVTKPRVNIVHNPHYLQGMATSLRCGVAALPADSSGVLVMLADMPFLTAEHLDRLIDAFYANPQKIIVPMHEGRRGNPVIWPRSRFAELQALTGDQGARALLTRYADAIVSVDMADAAILTDIDTPQDLARHSGNVDTTTPND